MKILNRTVGYFKNCRKVNHIRKCSCIKGHRGRSWCCLGQAKEMSLHLCWLCLRSLCHAAREGDSMWMPVLHCCGMLSKPAVHCPRRTVLFSQIFQLKQSKISHPASKQNEVSFDSAKCRWILQSKSALSVWCGTVTYLWHNIIWNDIEQHAFGTKLLAGFSFDSSKFIALIPRSFNPLWHKLRLAFVRKLHFTLSSFT